MCQYLKKRKSRDDWTRTSGLHVPNVARYQLRYISIRMGIQTSAFNTAANIIQFSILITIFVKNIDRLWTPFDRIKYRDLYKKK